MPSRQLSVETSRPPSHGRFEHPLRQIVRRQARSRVPGLEGRPTYSPSRSATRPTTKPKSTPSGTATCRIRMASTNTSATWTLTGPHGVAVYAEIDRDEIGTERMALIVDRWSADASLFARRFPTLISALQNARNSQLLESGLPRPEQRPSELHLAHTQTDGSGRAAHERVARRRSHNCAERVPAPKLPRDLMPGDPRSAPEVGTASPLGVLHPWPRIGAAPAGDAPRFRARFVPPDRRMLPGARR